MKRKSIAPPHLLTTQEVASLLGLTKRRILRMIRENGKFKGAQKLPGQTGAYLIPEKEVRAEVERRRKKK
jgi:excisionase family DNA binding protein